MRTGLESAVVIFRHSCCIWISVPLNWDEIRYGLGSVVVMVGWERQVYISGIRGHKRGDVFYYLRLISLRR
jgi:hypothetical protein